MAAPETDTIRDSAFKVAFLIGAFIGGFIVGALCGLLPLYFGTRRGRPKLAIAAMVSCAAAGLVLGILLAAPTALVFTVIILAIPRVVPEDIIVPSEIGE